MPESLKLPSYEERASSQLGVGDYLKKHVVSLLLPVVGFAAGLGLRKLIKHPMLDAPYVFPLFTPKAMRDAVEAGAQGQYVWRNAESWGLKAGGVWGLYSLWRDRAKAQYSIDDVRSKVARLGAYESTNHYLARENAELAILLGERPGHQVRAAERDGPVLASSPTARERS